MDTGIIQKMKDSGAIVLTKWQLFWHYSILGILLIVPVMTTIYIFEYYVTHTYNGVRTVEEMVLTGYPIIIPAILFYFIQRKRLHFKIIPVSVKPEEFKQAVQKTAGEMKWNIQQLTGNLAIAKSNFSWRSWGEHITIIRDDDKIFFNSICDPDNRPSVTSFGMNRLNKKIFEQELNKLTNENYRNS